MRNPNSPADMVLLSVTNAKVEDSKIITAKVFEALAEARPNIVLKTVAIIKGT